MSIASLLRARLGPPAQALAGSRVGSGLHARYLLSPDPGFGKSISAIWVMVKRHVPLLVAKRAAERLLVGQEVTVDVPMLEDAVLFEGELNALGVRAVKEAPSAAAEG